MAWATEILTELEDMSEPLGEVGLKVAGLVEEAAWRIKPHVLHTPLIHTKPLSRQAGLDVYLKLENEQVTGSFKVRGAFNKALVLTEGGDVTSIFTASSGNHGLGSGLAFRSLGVAVQVAMCCSVDQEKKEKLREVGCTLIEHGTDQEEAESYARTLATLPDHPYISPYNDYHVIAGQGTVGREILEDLPEVDAIFLSVGGGGLASGLAPYVKSKRPQCQVVACSPTHSKVMYESVKAGKIIWEESHETLSDATAGGVEEDSITFPLCRDLVDRWVLVEEEEIAEAVFYCLKHHKKVVEGAAGVALAAVKKVSSSYKGKKVAVVLCGANISIKNLHNIITTHTDKQQ